MKIRSLHVKLHKLGAFSVFDRVTLKIEIQVFITLGTFTTKIGYF